MKDRGAVIEQRLDVDELPRPVPFLEDALAQRKAIWPQGFGTMRAGQVLRAGSAKHALPFGRWWRLIQTDQDLTQLDPSVRLDHDDLTALQGGAAFR
jgi:hypothetical protein